MRRLPNLTQINTYCVTRGKNISSSTRRPLLPANLFKTNPYTHSLIIILVGLMTCLLKDHKISMCARARARVCVCIGICLILILSDCGVMCNARGLSQWRYYYYCYMINGLSLSPSITHTIVQRTGYGYGVTDDTDLAEVNLYELQSGYLYTVYHYYVW